MNKFEAWAITIAILLVMAATPVRVVLNRLIFVFFFLPLLLVGLLIFI